MVIPLSYSVRSLLRRPATTLATVLGIALVVFVLASSAMLAAGVRSTLLRAGSDERAIVLGHDAQAEDNSGVKQSVLALVAAAPGVRRSAEGRALVTGESVVQLPFSKLGTVDQNFSVQFRGVTGSSFELRPALRIVAGRQLKTGTAEAIIGRGLLDTYEGLALGSKIDVGKNVALKVVGVFEASGSAFESEVWTDLDTLRNALGWEGYLSSVTAQLTSSEAFDAFELALERDKREGLQAEREKAYYRRMSQDLFDAIAGLGAIVTFIFALGAILGAAITMYAAVGQRTREIGVLKAIGFTPTQVLLAFVFESTLLALLGAGFGIALSLVTPWLDFSTTNAANGQAIAFRFLPSVPVLAGALVTGALVGIVGGFFPALRAARISPTTAMRA